MDPAAAGAEATAGQADSLGGDQTANPQVRSQNYVGPTVGRELIWAAFWSLLIGCILITILHLLPLRRGRGLVDGGRRCTGRGA